MLKEKLVVTDCDKQEELEENYNNKLCQNLTEKALYYKNGAALYIIFFGQLHSDIVTTVRNSTTPLFESVHKDHDVVELLSIFRLICVKNLSGFKVDPYLDQLKILTTTLSYTQKRAHPITMLVKPYMTRSLIPRVNMVYSYLVTTITHNNQTILIL